MSNIALCETRIFLIQHTPPPQILTGVVLNAEAFSGKSFKIRVVDAPHASLFLPEKIMNDSCLLQSFLFSLQVNPYLYLQYIAI